jgi:hypothetical protein
MALVRIGDAALDTIRGLCLSGLLHAPLCVWALQQFRQPFEPMLAGPPELVEVGLEPSRAPPDIPPPAVVPPEPPLAPPLADSEEQSEAPPVTEEPALRRPASVSSPPPPAAQAGRALAMERDDDPAVVYDWTIVQGTGQRYVGGVTHARGKGRAPVYDRAARPRGIFGGQATEAPAPQPTAKAKPRPKEEQREPTRATPVDRNWKCPFPLEADQARVNHAVVRLLVVVDSDGTAVPGMRRPRKRAWTAGVSNWSCFRLPGTAQAPRARLVQPAVAQRIRARSSA